MSNLIPVELLSPAQRAFAEQVEARPMAMAASLTDAAFLYCREGGRSTRWLVDSAGRVLECDTFSARQPR